MLHLSSAVLSKNVTEPKSKSYVTVTMRGSDASKTLKNLTIAVLTPDKNEMQPLDIYCNISQDVTISCQGKNEVHMAGYFEPNQEVEAGFDPNELDDDDDEEMELEDDEDDDDEEEVPAKKTNDAAGGKATAGAAKKEASKDKGKQEEDKLE